MKLLVLLVALMLLVPSQQTNELPIFRGRIVFDESMPAPHGARFDSLLRLMFDTYAVEPPERVEIILVPYGQYERLVAENAAGPNWRAYLAALRREQSPYMTSSGFWRQSTFPDGLTIVTWDLNDLTLVHETSHYICQRLGESLNLGWHRQGVSDCTSSVSHGFWHSKVFRQWLRDRPWR